MAPQPTVETDRSVNIDPSLVQDCPKLIPLNVQNYTKEQAVSAIGSLLNIYSDCWHNHHSLSGIAVKAFNMQAPIPAQVESLQ